MRQCDVWKAHSTDTGRLKLFPSETYLRIYFAWIVLIVQTEDVKKVKKKFQATLQGKWNGSERKMRLCSLAQLKLV